MSSEWIKHLLVEEVEADAVVPLADDVVAEDGRVPAVARLLVVGLLAERLLALQGVARRRLGAAVDGVVGVGRAVDAVVVAVRVVRLRPAPEKKYVTVTIFFYTF